MTCVEESIPVRYVYSVSYVEYEELGTEDGMY